MKSVQSDIVKKLIELLKKDPTLKEQLKRFKGRNDVAVPEAKSPVSALLNVASVMGKFTGKKKALILAAHIDTVVLLVSLSMFLKTNVFDRPEIQEFFKKAFDQSSIVAQKLFTQGSEIASKLIEKSKKAA